MDDSPQTAVDALLIAARDRMQHTLDDTIDVGDRLRRFKETADIGWWNDLMDHRDALVDEAARMLTPPPARDRGRAESRDGIAANRPGAELIVERVYRDARADAPHLRRLTPAARRQRLLCAILDQVRVTVHHGKTRRIAGEATPS